MLQPALDISLVSARVQIVATLVIAFIAVAHWQRPNHRPRHHLWICGWIALATALVAVGLAFGYVGWPPAEPIAVPFLLFVYLAGKLLFLALLVAGALADAREHRPDQRTPALLGAVALLYAVLVVAVADSANGLVVWQSGPSALAFAVAGALTLRGGLRTGRPGHQFTGFVLLAMSVQWIAYGIGFARRAASVVPVADDLLDRVVTGSAFLDTGAEVLLGLGMLLMLNEEMLAFAVEQREREVRASAAAQERLRRIIDSAAEGILTLDEELRIVQANRAAAGILGTLPVALEGEDFGRFVDATIADRWRDELGLRDGGGLRRQAFPARRAGGERFPAELSSAPLAGGGWVLVLRDRTEEESARTEREALHQRLAQARRLEAVGQLMSGVAHELNNPLTAVLGFAEELAQSSLAPQDAESVRIITEQAQRCRVIVRDLLAAVRKREVAVVAVDIGAVAERVARTQQPRAALAGVSITVEVDRGLPPVAADDGALEQVLVNLVANAIQASPTGSTVVISAFGDASLVYINVEDEGPGIDPTSVDRLFEPFYTTKAVGEGTGLGLAVSRSIVERFGGTLLLRNRARGGAVASVALPAGASLAPPPSAPPAPPVPSAATAPAGRRRALVVDDELAIRSALRRFLLRRGWQVDEAANGEVALEFLGRAEGDEYDVVLCDIRMPRMSGIELHAFLSLQRPRLLERIIFMTGDVASPNVADFLARTRRPVVEKPFDLPALGVLVDELTGPQAAATGATPVGSS